MNKQMSEKRRAYKRAWYAKNKDRLREKMREYHRNYARKRRGTSYANLGGQCGIGRAYEVLALQLLNGARDCNVDNFRGKWDIEWNGKRIDVKMKHPNKDGCYNFSELNNRALIDYYLFFCVSRSGAITKVLLIPSRLCTGAIEIGGIKSKYDKYIVTSALTTG